MAWTIRDELIPLFGCVYSLFTHLLLRFTSTTRPNFPSTCLSPDQQGFGQVIPSGQLKRRSRKSGPNAIMQIAPVPSSWSVVTTNSGQVPLMSERPQLPFRRSDYPYPSNHQYSPSGVGSFGPSRPGYPPSAYCRPMPSTRLALSVDTRSLYSEQPSSPYEQVRLPPIQSPGGMSPRSPYALPPISALEDLRGSITQDSAAILRRLRMEDDDYPNSKGMSELPRPYAPSSP